MIRDNYKIYKSGVILDSPVYAKEECNRATQLFNRIYPDKNSTYNHDSYNIFSLTSCNQFFYYLYKEINEVVRDFVGDDRPLWMAAWLNAQSSKDVLDWHYHESQYHGYVVIDKHYGNNPIITETTFNNWKIKNEIGNIYMGYCGFDHKVEVIKPYDGLRHTLAFQVTSEPTLSDNSYYPVL